MRAASLTRSCSCRLAWPVILGLQGGYYIGLLPERAAKPLLASGALVRIGLLEVTLRYGMFGLRSRNIDLRVAELSRAARGRAGADTTCVGCSICRSR